MSECNHSPTVQLRALTNDNKCPVCLAVRLAEAVAYLDANPLNSIHAGSILHRKMAARATDSAEHRETETHG